MYWIEQIQDGDNNRTWEKYVIDSEWSQPHFMFLADLDNVGFGINSQAADIDSDGDIDIVAPGKSGLCLLENLLK